MDGPEYAGSRLEYGWTNIGELGNLYSYLESLYNLHGKPSLPFIGARNRHQCRVDFRIVVATLNWRKE
jgi:hypothetical protein